MERNFLQNIPWWNRLRGKLFLIIAFLLAFGLILVGFVGVRIYKSNLLYHAKECNIQIGRSAYQFIDSYLDKTYRRLSSIAKDLNIKENDPLEIKEQLEDALEQLQNVGLLVVYSNTGKEIAKAVKNEKIFLKRIYNQINSKTHIPPMIHSPVYATSIHDSMIDIYLDIANNAQDKMGILRGSVSFETVWKSLPDLRVNQEQELYIVDDAGYLIAHTELGVPSIRKDFGRIKKVNEFIFHVTKDGSENALIYKNSHGVDVLGTLTVYPSLNWGIIVELPLRLIIQPLRLFMKRMVLFILLIFVAAMLLGTFLIKVVTHPYEEAYRKAYTTNQGETIQPDLMVKNEANRIEQLFTFYKKTIQEKNLILNQHKENIKFTERKLKETDEENARITEKLDMSQRFIKDFIEGVNILILRLDLNGKVFLYNKKCQEIIGYERDRILGANWFLMVYAKEQGQKQLNDYQSYFRNGAHVPHYIEESIIAKNGKIKIIAWHNVKLYDKDKKVISILRIGEDITQRKKLVRELKKENETLKKNNAELENILSIVSHDLKTPLYILQDFASILVEDYQKSFGEEVRYYLERIKVNAEYMEKLIIDLLDLTRIGGVEKEKQLCVIGEIVERVMAEFQNRIQEKHIRVTVADHFPSVYCDANDILRVFMNLVSNAIKFLRSDSQESLIEIGYAEREDCHEFFVKDNGIGIEKEYHGKIFVIFQRLQERENLEGTGVGLTIVKKIIEEHGGVVWVDSEKGKGATFYFTLPKMKSDYDIYNIENTAWNNSFLS
ncbi:MAG: ATP-binding protein [bacterium]